MMPRCYGFNFEKNPENVDYETLKVYFESLGLLGFSGQFFMHMVKEFSLTILLKLKISDLIKLPIVCMVIAKIGTLMSITDYTLKLR